MKIVTCTALAALVVLFAQHAVAADPTCPVREASITLTCQSGDGQLSYLSHQGNYSVTEESKYDANAGCLTCSTPDWVLGCTYEPDESTSVLKLNGKKREIRNVDDKALRRLAEQAKDMQPSHTWAPITDPSLKIIYDLKWFGRVIDKKSKRTYFDAGLGALNQESHKLVFQLDKSGDDIGLGHSYVLGTNCAFTVTPLF